MAGKIRHISRRVYPQKVSILINAPAALVNERHEHGEKKKYQTNRHIKYWSTYFLLKSLTTTSFIQHWVSQKKYILHWLQMNENTFRHHLAWLKEQGLCEIDKHTKSIKLCSYDHAAEQLGIINDGLITIAYDPGVLKGKQVFQYIIRVEEIEANKLLQLETLTYKLNKNPSLKNDLLYHMVKLGADQRRLYMDAKYFAWRLLKTQAHHFKEGTDILAYLMTLRADINRGVKRISKHHGYKSTSSVSYMKRRMLRLKLVDIYKLTVESTARGRFYIPLEQDTPDSKNRGGAREGFKYLPKRKSTAWFLTDQVKRLYRADINNQTQKNQKYAA